MKTILAVALFFSAHAFAADSGTISCKTISVTGNQFQVEITLDAKVKRVDSQDPKAEQITLHDVSMTVKGLDKGDETESGRAAQILGKINPRATKYKEFYTTAMDDLKNVKDSNQFAPYDECFFNVYLPTNLWSKSRFEAPVVAHCDQNGGTQALECDLN